MRYEDLISNTEAQMRDVAEYLGIDFNPRLLVPTVVGASVGSNSAFGRGAEGIIVAATHAGARDGAQTRLVEIFAGPVARTFGYASAAPTGLAGVLARCSLIARLAPRLALLRLRNAVSSFRRRQREIHP